MADRKISDLTALTTPAAGDYLPIVDISEVAASSKNKRITIEELLRGAPDGTAAAPSIGFESDPNTGIYSPGADQLAISTNGTRRLIILSDGKVGLGAASVLQQGSGVDGGSAAGVLELYNGGTGNTTLENTGAFPILFKTNGSERLRITSTGQLSHIGAGSSGSPAVSFNGSAPSNSLVITSAGLVGVGTSSPGARLHSVETSAAEGLRIDGAAGGFSLVVEGGTTRATRIRQATIGNSYGGNTPPTDGLLVQGSVGIGTTSPNSVLQVNSGTNLGGILVGFNASSSNFYDADLQVFRTGNGTERARIDSSGRLLVGTSSSPNAGGGQYSRIVAQGYTGGSTGAGDIAIARGITAASGGIANNEQIGICRFTDSSGFDFAHVLCEADGTAGTNDFPGRLVFSTTADGASSPTERMRINSAGEVCIGTTSAHVANRSALENATTGQLTFRHSSTTAGHFNIVGMNSGSAFVVSDSSGATGVQLAYSGTSWSTLSDERQKTDLTPIDDGLTKVGTLRAVTGRLVTDPETKSRSFLIAQDVQAVLPQAVDTTDPDALALSYTEVIPLLVAALKESKERIETLEAKVAALETK